MKYTDAIERLDALGDDKWAVYKMARQMIADGREILPEQVLCLPGTQTALYAVISAVAASGDKLFWDY